MCFWLCKEKIAEEYRFQCSKIKKKMPDQGWKLQIKRAILENCGE